MKRKNEPLSWLAALALISLSMRFLAFSSGAATEPEVKAPQVWKERPRDEQASQDLSYLLSLNARLSPEPIREKGARPNRQRFICGLPLFQEFKGKVEPYQSSSELRNDLDHRDRWLGSILVEPVNRKGKSIGIRLTLTTPDPFTRLGLKSGDILISLNGMKFNRIENCPILLTELRAAGALHFLVERKGVQIPIRVELDR